jgi:outer membrane protein assembly factor BamA
VVFEDLAPLPERAIASLQEDLPIRPGEPLDQALVVSARGMIARQLQDHGYPFARVAVEERPGTAQGRITLVFVGLPGESAVFGPITVEGNASVGENVIRRALAFRPGDRFSLARLQLSQRRLYDLALFRLVYVDFASEKVANGQLPIHVSVLEADHREVRFSLGYGTEELVRAESRLAHLNFFGGARTGSILGKWSSLDRGIRAEFRQPFLFRPSLSLSASGQSWFADEPAYKLHTRGGRVTVTHELTQQDVVSRRGGVASVSLSWIYEAEAFAISTEALGDLSIRNQLIGLGLDPRTGEGAGLLNALAIDFQRTTTTNVLDSSQGYLVQAHLERGGSWLPGDFDYLEATLEGRHYQRLGPLGVFATRARIGSIDGRGDDTIGAVPFFKRYFLGGSKGLRGWGRFEVGPLSGSGLPLGGHSLLELSAELRMPRTGRFGLVWFVDAGNVWVDSWDIDLSDLRYDTGPGLRVNSPIGPLRIDLAYQLTPIEGLLVNGKPEPRRWRLHLSIGQSF